MFSSLRSKFLLIVLGGGVIPLGLVGLWLTRSAQRSGEELLRSRLDSVLVHAAQDAGTQWAVRRSVLLSIGEDSLVRRELGKANTGQVVAARFPLPRLASTFSVIRDNTQLVLVSDRRSIPRWAIDVDSAGIPVLVPASDSLRVAGRQVADRLTIILPIQNQAGDTLGTIAARFLPGSLAPATFGSAAAAGAVLGVIDRKTQSAMAPLPFDPMLLRQNRFTWAGEEWLSASRMLDDPEIELLAAAPLGAFTLPFETAAQRGFAALMLVSLAAVTVTVLLTRRVTRSLVQLAHAAEGIAQGDLERRVEPQTKDEVGRLAGAFNIMSDSLRRTMAELSQRQAVAAVGEFASALAHEIRNPLSAIRLNLQHLEERVALDAELRTPVGQVLRDVNRLDSTVAGALRVARTGRMTMEQVDLGLSLAAAESAAQAEFTLRHVTLDRVTGVAPPIWVRGNGPALEQLFLNLLLNAAQASPVGSRAGARIVIEDTRVIVEVNDCGPGFDDQMLQRAFEPFHTTRPEGTGLGLTVARRIVTAHRGTIEIRNMPSAGARVIVRLPLLQ